MSIAKPFTFVANTYAKASEVNANFDAVYSQVNSNISAIAQNATDIDNLENNKADINGSSAQRFAVADAITNGDAINKQTLFKSIGNSINYISGFTITKDNGSPEDTIIVSAGSCYDSTKTIVLSLSLAITKQNLSQASNATYYVYIIGNSTGSQTDILISESSTSPGLPTGYSLYRQIGSYTTDGSAKINSISYYGIDASSDKSSSAITDACMPDYANGLSVSSPTSSSPFTAPSNGVYVELGLSPYGSDTSYLNINGVNSAYGTHNAGGYYDSHDSVTVPLNKGDEIYWTTGLSSYKAIFYPLKGAN
jgi:hypothetical protein